VIRLPTKPDISASDLADLEKLGVEAVRAQLATHSGLNLVVGPTGPSKEVVYKWLDWKSAKADLWNKAAVVLAFVAAIASVVAAVEGWPSLK
jgi:hypothetical protein